MPLLKKHRLKKVFFCLILASGKRRTNFLAKPLIPNIKLRPISVNTIYREQSSCTNSDLTPFLLFALKAIHTSFRLIGLANTIG